MTLAGRLRALVRAAFSGLYVHSYEHQDAIAEIARLCHDEGWTPATWDLDRGLAIAGHADEPAAQATDPLAALRALGALATPDGTALLVASVVGLLWESWIVGVLAFAGLLAGGLATGDLRPRRRGR